MRILFAAPENSWGGVYHRIRKGLAQHEFEATDRFEIDSLKGIDVLLPTMSAVTRKLLEESDRLILIQQCGAGIQSIDLEAARDMNIPVANVPTTASGMAESVAEIGVYFMIGLSRDVQGMARILAEQKVG